MPAVDHSERIADAVRRQHAWIALNDDEPRGDAPFQRVEMHVPTGVVVVYGGRPVTGGRMEFYTESHFVNRRTGLELGCGSRRWNEGTYDDLPSLLAAVAAARDDVPRRFPGLVRIHQRQRAGDRTGAV